MSDLATAVESLELALGYASRVMDPDVVAGFAKRVQALKDKQGFLGESVVLALAGGTGSGKSSLLNAIAGSPVAETGVLRPCTDLPLAWIPNQAESGLSRMLDRLGIQARVGHDRHPRLAIIDLPDHDSVVEAHREMVEHILPEVDGVVWVLDPEKYRDQLLHDGYLVPLVDHAEQFLFVLNQTDRLGAGEREEVERDLVRLLHRDGIRSPLVFATAAAPPGSPPQGMEPLQDYIGGRLDTKRMATGKLLADIRNLRRLISSAAGLERGAKLGFDSRWKETRDQASATGGGNGLGSAAQLVDDLATAISVEVGGHLGHRIRQEFTGAGLDLRMAAGVEPLSAAKPSRRRRRAQPDRKIADVIQLAVGNPLRALLVERGFLGAALATAEIDVLRADQRGGELGVDNGHQPVSNDLDLQLVDEPE